MKKKKLWKTPCTIADKDCGNENKKITANGIWTSSTLSNFSTSLTWLGSSFHIIFGWHMFHSQLPLSLISTSIFPSPSHPFSSDTSFCSPLLLYLFYHIFVTITYSPLSINGVLIFIKSLLVLFFSFFYCLSVDFLLIVFLLFSSTSLLFCMPICSTCRSFGSLSLSVLIKWLKPAKRYPG